MLIPITVSFFWAYSQVKNNASNVAFTCVVNFTLYGTIQALQYNSGLTCDRNIYYGTLYAYTPEVLPTAHRSTGYGIALGYNRVMGLVSTIIGSVSARFLALELRMN